jgi:hypothetical protein
MTIFEAQSDAYLRTERDETLRSHTPQYFGVCSIDAVIDEDENILSNLYFLDACYTIEKLDGSEKKVNDQLILNQYPHIREIRHCFDEHGIDTGDASVFSYSDLKSSKLIDFTSRNFG